MTAREQLAALGLELPPPPSGVGAYEPWVQTGNLVMTSLQLPWQQGALAYTGLLGAELQVEDGYAAARLCALNGIAQLNSAAGGDLERVRVLRLEGHVGCTASFEAIPQVLNGASDVINAVFGERGRHVRTAQGHLVMPLRVAVMVGFWAELRSDG
jgi:enamine deaminase RidA (YjgF/YER057c/UK114 family)